MKDTSPVGTHEAIPGFARERNLELPALVRPCRTLLIGRGAVSELFYLPLFRKGISGISLVGIVDPALSPAGKSDPGVLQFGSHFDEVFGRSEVMACVDAVLVALPHHLHARCVIAALERGKHVFCEKPLAMTAREVSDIVEARDRAGRIVAVCQPRRHLPAAGVIKEMLAGGKLGALRSITWEEGHPYRWPAATLDQIQGRVGGSELFDIGAHVFDLLSCWAGPMVLRSYEDDSRGGTAAEFKLSLVSNGNVKVEVALSRLHRLRNAVILECDAGRILWDLKDPSGVAVEAPSLLGSPSVRVSPMVAAAPSPIVAGVAEELLRFSKAVRGERSCSVAPEDAMRVAMVFDQARAEVLARPPSDATLRACAGSSVVVTGASGFIGTAIVERLVASGRNTLALVHTPRNAVRLARLNAEMKMADITDPASLSQAIKPGSVVIHCAVSHANTEAVIVEGTLNVLRAAKAAQASRVVIVSSMLAMGDPPLDGDVDEGSKLPMSGMEYGRAKARMEELARQYAKKQGIDVVFLRPTCVFGPFGLDFVSAPLNAMLEGRFHLIDGGTGRANLIYVDNLVDAILLAAERPGIGGRTYILNEEESQVSWGHYFSALMQPIKEKVAEFPSFSRAELEWIEAKWRRKNGFLNVFREAIRSHPASSRWLRQSRLFTLWLKVKGKVRPDRGSSRGGEVAGTDGSSRSTSKSSMETTMLRASRNPVDAAVIGFYSSRAIYSSRLARHELGWIPKVSRHEAMTATTAWVEKAYRYHD